jgi:putative intracellular protease/amidase
MVAVAGRLVIGQNPASAEGVGEAMVRVLGEVKAAAGR